jgi:hypothetical protein
MACYHLFIGACMCMHHLQSEADAAVTSACSIAEVLHAADDCPAVILPGLYIALRHMVACLRVCKWLPAGTTRPLPLTSWRSRLTQHSHHHQQQQQQQLQQQRKYMHLVVCSCSGSSSEDIKFGVCQGLTTGHVPSSADIRALCVPLCAESTKTLQKSC